MQDVLIRDGVAADVAALLEIESRAASLLLEHGGHDLLANFLRLAGVKTVATV